MGLTFVDFTSKKGKYKDTYCFLSSGNQSLIFNVPGVYNQFYQGGLNWLFPKPHFTVDHSKWLIDNFNGEKFIQLFNQQSILAPYDIALRLYERDFHWRDIIIEGSLVLEKPSLKVLYQPSNLIGLSSHMMLSPYRTSSIPISTVISNYFKQTDMAEFLLDRGYSLQDIITICKHTGLEIAHEKPWLDKMNRLLLARKRPLELSTAIRFQNANFVLSSLENGASSQGHIESGKYKGYTMLGCAVEMNHPGIVQSLLAYRANPNLNLHSSDGYQGTLLSYALRKNYWAIASQLIAAGAEVQQTFSATLPWLNTTLTSQFTPLLFAAVANNTELVLALLEKGANPYVVENTMGIGPFVAASVHKNPDMLNALLERISDAGMQECASTLEKSAYLACLAEKQRITAMLNETISTQEPAMQSEDAALTHKLIATDEAPVQEDAVHETSPAPQQQFGLFAETAVTSTPSELGTLRRACRDKNAQTVATLYDSFSPDAKSRIPKGLKGAIDRLLKQQTQNINVISIDLQAELCEIVTRLETGTLSKEELPASLDKFPASLYDAMRDILANITNPAAADVQQILEIKAAEIPDKRYTQQIATDSSPSCSSSSYSGSV